MAAKKTLPKKPVSKTAFVRSLPASMSGADVVKKAKEAGIDISLAYVYGIRSKSPSKKKVAKTGAAPSSDSSAMPPKRGPRRSRKAVAVTNGNGRSTHSAGGLEAAIEAIVERKVAEILKGKLGSLFG